MKKYTNVWDEKKTAKEGNNKKCHCTFKLDTAQEYNVPSELYISM